MTTATLQPRIPMADYHAWDAASNSRLSHLMRSPAHLRAYLDEPFADTPALAFGRAAHTAILEPDEFESRYLLAEQCSATTTKKTRCSKAGTIPLLGGGFVCGIHGNQATEPDTSREILSPEDWRRCAGMRDAVHDHERASAILDGLQHVEVSIQWNDRETGVPCKGRWDGYSEVAGGTIIDLKTTVDARRRSFERSIFDFGYHRQGAMYLEAADAVGIPARHYVIIAQEKMRPYAPMVYRLDAPAIEAGSDQLRVLLRRYAECLKTDTWPGYSTDVQDVGLPSWAWDQLEEQVT